MRVAQISATYPPDWCGTGNVCFYNSQELCKRGHEVHVYTPILASTKVEEPPRGVYIHRLKPVIRFGNAALLPGLFRLRDYDVIHYHYPFFGGEFAALATSRYKVPLIITYHQDVHLRGLLNYLERLIRITLSSWLLRHAEKVLFTSIDYSQASYARNILRGRENHIGELSNGVDIHHFSPGGISPSFKSTHKPSSGDKIALLVSRLDRAHYFKGVRIFLQALSRLPESIKAIIVGDGDMKEEYMGKAQSLNLSDRVFFAGQVPIDDLPNYYRLADVTVLPSTTMGEAFGLVLVESLACATPVIASNLPGVRSVVASGVDGYLVNPGDAQDLRAKIEQVLSQPESVRAEMGAAGRHKVIEKYSWPKIVERLEQVYLSAVHNHPCGDNI